MSEITEVMARAETLSDVTTCLLCGFWNSYFINVTVAAMRRRDVKSVRKKIIDNDGQFRRCNAALFRAKHNAAGLQRQTLMKN